MFRFARILVRLMVGALRRSSEDLRAMYTARWELARLEIKVARSQIQRLGIVLGVALLLVISALPVLLVALSFTISRWQSIDPELTTWVLGGAVLLIGLVIAAAGWLRFRRQFVGMQATTEELQEDVMMLREWVQRYDGDE